ncbi:hypothetical protein R1flu_022792 [Riccia fluitans]|uniref:Uncharacterized protein n=1 Tax=Riccia fluitans TaxID=41844 RepID=A0ABD1XQ86_9MARC
MGNKVPKTEGIHVPVELDHETGGNRTKGRKVVMVITRDGKKLMFDRGMYASKLLMAFPGHAVFRVSEELEYLGRARALSPKDSLKRGNTYLLLPQTQKDTQKSQQRQQRKRSNSKVNPIVCLDSDSDKENLMKQAERHAAPKISQTIKVRMTKQQLAEMIGNGYISLGSGQAAQDLMKMTVACRRPTDWSCSMRLFNHPQSNLLTAPSLARRTWNPELASILEVPSQ